MMLRFIAFFLLLTVSLGPVPAAAADPVFPVGSRMGFVPPPGFVASKRFPGFENPDSRSSIVMATLPPQAYANLEASMAPEALVAVLVPESALKTYSDDVIRASLSSLAVRATVPLDEQIALVPFKLTDLSGLRPVRVLGNTGVVLTDGAKDAPTPSDQPMFAVMIGQGGPEQATDRVNFARNLFAGLSDVKDVHIINGSGDMLRLGGGTLVTHELQAEAKEAFTDTPVKLVQWVRFGSGSFIRMLGIARADQWPAAFPHFRAVRDGVAPRE